MKNQLVLCELYNSALHGPNDEAEYHYLLNSKFDGQTFMLIEDDELEEDDNDSNDEDVSIENNLLHNHMRLLKFIYNRLARNYVLIHNIRNYRNVILQTNYIQPHIAECIELPESGAKICILKTFWIRLIQRTWRRICKERKSVIQRRTMISSLKYREIHGYWPDGLNVLQSIYGMLA